MEMEPERLRKQKHTFQRIRQKKREFFAIWFGGNSTYLHIWDPQKNSNIIPTREHIDAYPQIFILINTSSFGPLNLIWWKQQHLRAKKKNMQLSRSMFERSFETSTKNFPNKNKFANRIFQKALYISVWLFGNFPEEFIWTRFTLPKKKRKTEKRKRNNRRRQTTNCHRGLCFGDPYAGVWLAVEVALAPTLELRHGNGDGKIHEAKIYPDPWNEQQRHRENRAETT